MNKRINASINLWLIPGMVLLLMVGCDKEENNNTANTVTDIDGNIYHTVIIGTQEWMVENLKVTRYRNGDLIGTTTPAALNIGADTTPKYQWAYDGDENNVADYGRLYTWYVIADERNVCPTGWHVPGNDEWTTLINYLGGTGFAGGKLKETGTSHWFDPNRDANNESGFTGLPGGLRMIDEFSSIRGWGMFWSSTENNEYTAWYWSLYYDHGGIEARDNSKNRGLSIRCIKD